MVKKKKMVLVIPERGEMGKKYLIIAFLVCLMISGSGCSRKIVTAVNPGRSFNTSGYEYLYIDAIRQKLMGNIGDAMEEFQKCIEINPQSDASYYQMAQIVLSKGDLKNGKKYLRQACEISPENIWYNMLLAGIYHQENNIDSTTICYERAVKANPEKEDLLISLAGLYTERKEFAKARNILNRFDEKYGVNEKTTISLVETLMAEGRTKEAREKVLQYLKEEPDNIILNGYLAEIYKKEGDIQKAREVYKELISRNPNNPGIQLSLIEFLESEKSYDELFDLLNVAIINEKISREDKITVVSKLIEDSVIIKRYQQKMELQLLVMEAVYKNDNIVMLLRPEFLENQKNNVQAAERLEEIIKTNRDNYFAWEKLLLLYLQLHDYKMLEKRGEECATNFNRSVIAKLLYATGAMENGNFQIALEELRKADILAGDNKEIKLQIITLRADIYYRMKNFEEAFKAYEEALRLNNNDLTVMNNYAYYLAEQDMNLKEAEKMARMVIEREKGNNTFLDTYAWVLYKRGKSREAARVMEKILASEEKNDAEYYEHYGFILRKIGKCNEAVKSWQKAILIDDSKAYLEKEIENCKK
jgi:Tfp pilus assembly protein PilF